MPVYQLRTMITLGYQATISPAIRTALGAKVACSDKKVFCISGNGGSMFNVQVLSTAVAHNVDVTIIVFNDSAFGNVKHYQKEKLLRSVYRRRSAQPGYGDAGPHFWHDVASR